MATGKADEPALPEPFGTAIQAVLFDLDGVVTRAAAIHARAWQRLFDRFLAEQGDDPARFGPFRLPDDYRAYVDDKPRYEGVRRGRGGRGRRAGQGMTAE